MPPVMAAWGELDDYVDEMVVPSSPATLTDDLSRA